MSLGRIVEAMSLGRIVIYSAIVYIYHWNFYLVCNCAYKFLEFIFSLQLCGFFHVNSVVLRRVVFVESCSDSLTRRKFSFLN